VEVTTTAQPFVKWVGGKRSLLEEILSRLPKKFGNYHEPFVGGGAAYFAIAPNLNHATLADVNLELVLTYNTIKTDPHALI
jgi:DNA adenine methylase